MGRHICFNKRWFALHWPIRQRPHTYFALGFGGNGITFSVIAAVIIRDMLKLVKENKDADIFKFDR